MGILTDIVIANPDEAAAINAARGQHLKRWVCLESKGVDTIKLGTLSQILAGRSIDDIDMVASFMTNGILDQASDEGPWVFLVPGELQLALAVLDQEMEKRVAEKWAATEEFRLDRWGATDVQQYLHNLVAHARKAKDANKQLLLWMSL
ncbi:MAG TPA: hypothetical protein VGG44_01355 [Tepidisphaeraceae bacterium]|jgi:hypothetical protein